MKNYKKNIIAVCLIFFSLFIAKGEGLLTFEAGASVETGIKAVVSRTDEGMNLDDRIKSDKFLWEGAGQLYGRWYPSSFFTLSWDFLFKTSTDGRRLAVLNGMTYDTAIFKPELKNLYAEFTLPGGGILGLGRQVYNGGETFLYSPSNYLDPAGGIETGKSFWQVGTEWSISAFTIGLTWIPSLLIPLKNENDEGYSHLNFLENSNIGGIFALRVGWFPYPFNINLFGYMKEHVAWEMENFFLAGGLSFSYSIVPELIIRGEAFAGNGFNQQFYFSESNTPPYGQWISLDGNQVYAKITGGLSWAISSWLELSTEYLFNGTGMERDKITDLENLLIRKDLPPDFLYQTGSLLDPLEMGRHFILFRTRFDFPEINLLFNPYILISLLDGSFSQKGNLEWTPTDTLTLTGGWLWNGSPKGGVFSLIPSQLTISMGAKYAF